jgi:enoyl-CoA hydratase/carnithine racemase
MPGQNEHEFLEVRRSGRVAEIAWNRPAQRNAVSRGMLKEFIEVLRFLDRDDSVSVILFFGNGDCLSVGADLGRGDDSWELGGLPTDAESKVWPGGLPPRTDVGGFIELARLANVEFYEAYTSFLEISKPVVCFVHGWCMGAGAWFACAADITIASDDAVFGQPEVRQGEAFDVYWTFLIGPKRALRYGLTGDHFDSAEAMRIGLINEVVPGENGLSRAKDLAQRIASVPLDSLRFNKLVVRRAVDLMGARDALLVAREIGTLLSSSVREEPHRRFENAAAEGGNRAFFRERDAAFWPEPFGPRSVDEGSSG